MAEIFSCFEREQTVMRSENYSMAEDKINRDRRHVRGADKGSAPAALPSQATFPRVLRNPEARQFRHCADAQGQAVELSRAAVRPETGAVNLFARL